jgi:hypothetical protein
MMKVPAIERKLRLVIAPSLHRVFRPLRLRRSRSGSFPYIGGVASTVAFLSMLCVGQFAS